MATFARVMAASGVGRRPTRVRVVFGVAELREKIAAWDAGLDDRQLECAKLVVLRERPAVRGPDERMRWLELGGDPLVLGIGAATAAAPVRVTLDVPRAWLAGIDVDAWRPSCPNSSPMGSCRSIVTCARRPHEHGPCVDDGAARVRARAPGRTAGRAALSRRRRRRTDRRAAALPRGGALRLGDGGGAIDRLMHAHALLVGGADARRGLAVAAYATMVGLPSAAAIELAAWLNQRPRLVEVGLLAAADDRTVTAATPYAPSPRLVAALLDCDEREALVEHAGGVVGVPSVLRVDAAYAAIQEQLARAFGDDAGLIMLIGAAQRGRRTLAAAQARTRGGPARSRPPGPRERDAGLALTREADRRHPLIANAASGEVARAGTPLGRDRPCPAWSS
jgi:hypothetical protein